MYHINCDLKKKIFRIEKDPRNHARVMIAAMFGFMYPKYL